jgi:hypothetical protein
MKVTLYIEHLVCPGCGYPMHSVKATHRSRCLTDGCANKGRWYHTPVQEIELTPCADQDKP